jgi:hypothetical protein
MLFGVMRSQSDAETSQRVGSSETEVIKRFSNKVAKTHDGIRIVQVPSVDGSIVRFLVAPAEKFMDTMLPAQKARQVDAGALPPEIYGHDLFELLNGNVVRLRDGQRVNVVEYTSFKSTLDRFLTEGTQEYRCLVQAVEHIREGQRAAARTKRAS